MLFLDHPKSVADVAASLGFEPRKIVLCHAI